MNPRRPGKRPFVISAVIHVVIVVFMVVFARSPEPIQFETVRVTLFSPPPADALAPPTETPVIERQPEPEPEVEQPEPEPEVEPEPEQPEPEPEPPPERERPETEAPPDPPRTETRPQPDERRDTAATGGEGLNIATEGREFPYPEYLNNVIVQVNRFFRWSDESRPRGVVFFEILRDGSVRNIRMARSSGNIRFDFAVQGAVETAGNRGAFGPLPDGYAPPTLPVQIEVEPPR